MASIRSTKAIIDLGKIELNIRSLHGLTPNNTAFMAVVKANAYGHGIEKVAQKAVKAGVSFFGVSIPEEGMALRETGINHSILVFGALDKEQTEAIIRYNLTPTVSSLATALFLQEAAIKYNKNIDIHLKLDTGMGRIGLRENDELATFLKVIHTMKNLRVEGIYTHFALADHCDPFYTQQQIETYKRMLAIIKKSGIVPKWLHASNSAGIINFRQADFNMVRSGISIYGYYPSDDFDSSKVKIIPALEWVTKIVHLKTIEQGQSVSYGREYISSGQTCVATLPVGYADGYMRLLSNKGWVLIRGQRAPVIGRVCMDQIMVNVSNISGVSLGDEAVLLGVQGNEAITADDLAKICDTISYEILTSISSRVPREYINV